MTGRSGGERPQLRDRLRSGERALGVFLRMPNETAIEMCGFAGVDVVVIDCEHGPADDLALMSHARAADAAGVELIVRVGNLGGSEVLHALDAGATGVLAPHVDDVETAHLLVAAVRHPPAGMRGFATYTRAGGHGMDEAELHAARADARAVAGVMIESAKAVEAIDDILSVPGIDLVMPGPADLRHDLLTSVDQELEDVEQQLARSMERIRSVARDAGIATAAICSDITQVRAELEHGTTLPLLNFQASVATTLREFAAIG